jgi:glycosyltransferase involved in cell wall biosynthesis
MSAPSESIALVMTTYNSEDYLDRAIESILAQTHTDWHLTLWDDGSSDRSSDIARHYAALDGRIDFIAAPHTGRVIALADAIDAAPPHPYLAFVDSDDLLAPTALAETLAVLAGNPEIGVVYTNYLVIDPDDRVLGLGSRCQIPYSADRLLVDFISFHFRLLRRTAFDRVGGIDRNFYSAEDYDLCLKLSEITDFYHLERPLYYYRRHDLSISAITKAEQTEYSAKAVNDALVRRNLVDRYRFLVAPTGQFHLQQRQPQLKSSTIPKIIHQTWKDENIPPQLAALQQTWQEKHPDWEYKLWTDAENREFLARFYPWFLPIYDGYQHHICRVDAIRYFWLDYYGGVYIDLDFECLAPIDLLIAERSILLSLEPSAHTIENNLAKERNYLTSMDGISPRASFLAACMATFSR